MSAPRGVKPTWALVLAMNQLPLTRQCLTSVLALDPPADRVLLVDNGSTDGTAETVRLEFPAVEVMRLETNRYFAGGVNEGLRRALGQGARSVLLLNNDVVLERPALGKLRQALEADPRLAAVSPKIYYFDVPDVIWFAGGEVGRRTGLIRHRGVNVKDEKLRDGPRDFSPARRSNRSDSSTPSTSCTWRTWTGARVPGHGAFASATSPPPRSGITFPRRAEED